MKIRLTESPAEFIARQQAAAEVRAKIGNWAEPLTDADVALMEPDDAERAVALGRLTHLGIGMPRRPR